MKKRYAFISLAAGLLLTTTKVVAEESAINQATSTQETSSSTMVDNSSESSTPNNSDQVKTEPTASSNQSSEREVNTKSDPLFQSLEQGDFSRIKGTWQDEDGHQVSLDSEGKIFLNQQLAGKVKVKSLNTDGSITLATLNPETGQEGFPYLKLLPKGVDMTETDSKRDRLLFVTGNLGLNPHTLYYFVSATTSMTEAKPEEATPSISQTETSSSSDKSAPSQTETSSSTSNRSSASSETKTTSSTSQTETTASSSSENLTQSSNNTDLNHLRGVWKNKEGKKISFDPTGQLIIGEKQVALIVKKIDSKGLIELWEKLPADSPATDNFLAVTYLPKGRLFMEEDNTDSSKERLLLTSGTVGSDLTAFTYYREADLPSKKEGQATQTNSSQGKVKNNENQTKTQNSWSPNKTQLDTKKSTPQSQTTKTSASTSTETKSTKGKLPKSGDENNLFAIWLGSAFMAIASLLFWRQQKKD